MEAGDLWRVLTLTQTLGTDTPFEGLPPAWSLSLFMSFYLALPVWSWWRRRSDRAGEGDASLLRREVWWLLGLLLLSWVVRTTSATDPIAPDPVVTLLGRADWFAIGMILAVIVVARERGLTPPFLSLGQKPGRTLMAALGLTVASALVPVHHEEIRTSSTRPREQLSWPAPSSTAQCCADHSDGSPPDLRRRSAGGPTESSSGATSSRNSLQR